MSRMIRIVHLSDFHINSSGLIDLEQFIVTGLIEDLVNFNNEKNIDLIVFSGDLLDKAGKSFGDTDLAFYTFVDKVVDPILNALSLTRDRFLFVPGNHDIDRDMDSKISELGLTHSLLSTSIVNEYMDNNSDEGRNRIKSFKEFEKDFYSSFTGECILSDFQSNFIVNTSSTDIGITCFNSSWRCFDDTDKNKIILGERQITNSRATIGNCDIKIAVIHHPLDWLNSFEVDSIEAMITRDYDMLFCGHVHKGTSWSKTSIYGDLFYSIAPSNWKYDIRSSDRSFANGYSIVDFDKPNREIKVHHRRYTYLKEKYDPNTDLGDSNGIAIYRLPDTEELKKKIDEKEIIDRIRSVYITDINEHLLSYSTDTTAPKTIEEMFVLPQIVNDKKYNEEEQEKTYSLSELCNTKSNLLIIGSKESGKTILLDRLLMELSCNIDIYGRIPVYINFDEITNRIETLISRFLSIGILEIQDFISKHNVIILVDNISLSKKNKIKIIEEFTNYNPSIIIIGTITGIIEEEVPLEIFDYPVLSTFKSIHIKNFRTKEIKLLIQKWFSHNENYDPDKLNKIVQIFITLNIPRTPLAVSMFLWIIEQQENYKPVNNAVMLENFIERLFKKQSRKEIYSERFDYRNKERLLSEIAYQMYKIDQLNYRITYNQLRNFVHKYLRILKFGFDEESLLQEFVANGIFVLECAQQEVYLRFRFTCFFRYFLMKYMGFDDEFKKYVLSDENYLMFEDEIDYYTGLNRDESLILELLVSRMKVEFRELLSKINVIDNGFDAIFETKSSIASTIDSTGVKTLISKKPSEEELDQMNDNMLDNVKQEKGISKKELEISPFEKLFKSWSLAAKVLKNTEETKVENLKGDSFEDILVCSIAFAGLYKMLLTDQLEKTKNAKKTEENNYEKLNILNRFMPLIHQLVTFSYIGTGKLGIVIRESIEKKLNDPAISDMEKFMTVFLYADLKEEDYHGYISKFVNNTKSTYILDMILFKVTSYYYLRSTSKKSDNFYENLISDIVLKSQGQNKRMKYEIIEKYRTKRIHKRNEDHDNDEEKKMKS